MEVYIIIMLSGIGRNKYRNISLKMLELARSGSWNDRPSKGQNLYYPPWTIWKKKK